MSNPQVILQIQGQRLAAIAERTDSMLRQQLWATLLERAPGYGPYEKRTAREIPIILLQPVA